MILTIFISVILSVTITFAIIHTQNKHYIAVKKAELEKANNDMGESLESVIAEINRQLGGESIEVEEFSELDHLNEKDKKLYH